MKAIELTNHIWLECGLNYNIGQLSGFAPQRQPVLSLCSIYIVRQRLVAQIYIAELIPPSKSLPDRAASDVTVPGGLSSHLTPTWMKSHLLA